MNVENTFELIEAQRRYIDEMNLIRAPAKAPTTSLDFLRAVYCNEALPLSVRMRAAIAALPFEAPKLAVTANVQDQGIAALLEARLRRIAEAKNDETNPKVIENQPAQTVRMVPDQRLRRV
jgi:hypothetical protein